MRPPSRARAARVISAISAGTDPPLVSHKTTMSAPPRSAACQEASAYAGIVLVAVEGVLGVVDDEAALLGQEADRLLDHRQVLFRRRLQHFAHVQQPGLAENRHDRRFGVDQQPHLIVVLGADVLAPRRAERRELGVGEPPAFRRLEELDVFRVRSRPAALDVVHAEAIETLGDLELVGDGKRHTLALAAIAERRVVDFDFGSHPWR